MTRLSPLVITLCMLSSPSCMLGLAGGAAGGGLGYAIAGDDHKAAGAGVGAGVGLAIGTAIFVISCIDLPVGPYSMEGDPDAEGPKKPWYCYSLR